MIKLLNSPAIMVSGCLKVFLSSYLNELSGGLKFLLEDKQTGNNSFIINDEIVAMVDKWKSTEQNNLLLRKC